jgi:hypothetical protein
MPPTYTRTGYTPTTWVDVPDPNNPPAGAEALSAENLNKQETGIKQNRDGLHRVCVPLNTDELNAHDPIEDYPEAVTSAMVVTGATWPGDGIVFTHRVNAVTLTDSQIEFDFQEFVEKGTGKKLRRVALTKAKDPWVNNTAVSTGDIRQPTASKQNGFYYEVTDNGGTTAATLGAEPNWPTDNTPVTDNTVEWTLAGAFWSNWAKDFSETTDGSSSGLNADTLDDRDYLDIVALDQETFVGYVQSGLVASKDGTTQTQLNLTAGVAHLKQPDGTIRRRAISSTTFSTTTSNVTYWLYLRPDGTFLWEDTDPTPPSVPANSLFIAEVTTNAGNVNINTVTDRRVLSREELSPQKVPGHTNTGIKVRTPSADQTLTAATKVVANAELVGITAASPITSTAAPLIDPGLNGQTVTLMNNGTNTITLNHHGNGAVNSGLRLVGGTTIALGQRASVQLTYHSASGEWRQTGPLVSPA